MTDYHAIKQFCEDRKKSTASFIDDFLIYYAASKENLESEMTRQFAPYKDTVRQLDKIWFNTVRAQYIAHRIFKVNGLLPKYLKHSALKSISVHERAFLEYHVEHPWRFCFSRIIKKVADDFYEMEDVMTRQIFLLYTRGVSDILRERSVMIWFNLIAFNGRCWETFGPISAYSSFSEDDIFFFATEYNGDIESEDDIMISVEKNPVPYMMLYAFSALPLTRNKTDEVLQVIAEHDLNDFTTDKLKDNFTIQYSDSVYSLAPKKWCEPPHLAFAYYDERQKILLLTAMTERGFNALAETLIKSSVDIPGDPQIQVSMAMLLATESILKKKIRLNPYESLFQVKPSEVNQGEMDKINNFIARLLPQVNAGVIPDIESLAKEMDIDVIAARQLLDLMIKKKKGL
jgi:hypothetical protein